MPKALRVRKARRVASPAAKHAVVITERGDAAVARHHELVSRTFAEEAKENRDVIDLRHLAPRLRAGVHVSPFRDDAGRLVIVRIDSEGRLASMWPGSAIEAEWQLAVDHSARRVPEMMRPRHDDMEDFTVANSLDAALGDPFLTGGGWERSAVFICPWKGTMYADTVMLAVTDKNGCAHAFVEVDPDGDATVLEWPLAFMSEMRTDGMARNPAQYFAAEGVS